MDEILQAIRILVRNRGFTAVVVLTLALGIGTSTAMFSVVHSVLLEPLPYKDVSRLAVITEKDEKRNQVQAYSLSYVNYQDWHSSQKSFAELALFRAPVSYKVIGSDRTVISARMVSSNFLSLLGVSPIIGRDFTPEDDRPGATPTVILSYAGWQRLFTPQRGVKADWESSASLLGGKLRFNQATYDVIGVLAMDFSFYTADSNQNADAYFPIALSTEIWTTDRIRRPGISALGRLRTGTTPAAAGIELNVIADQLAAQYPDANENRGLAVDPILNAMVREDLRSTLSILSVATVLILLISVANVTNLLLVRTSSRQKEIAIRFALGGSWHVIRQLMTESLLVALAGGAIGIVVAIIATDILVISAPIGLPRIDGIAIDWQVLVFSLGISLLTALAFSVAPIVQAVRSSILTELKEGGTSSAAARHITQSAIIIVEVALAMVLLLAAGVVLRSTQKALNEDPGFDPKNIWSFAVVISPPEFPTANERRALMRRIETALSGLPEVRNVSAGIGGVPKPIAVDAEYLRLMGLRLLKGRFFEERDSPSAPPTIVIDDVLARARFRDEDPIGKPFVINLPGVCTFQLDRPREVVGVVSHIQRLGIETDDETVIQSQFYLPADQLPDELMEGIAPRVMIKTMWKEEGVPERLRAAIHSIHPNLEVSAPIKMQDAVERALLPRRYVSRLFGAFALVAFAMAGLGIFSLMSYSVAQRTQEIGVRLALGAEPGHVVRIVVGRAAALAGVGVVVGLVASVWLKQSVEKVVAGVNTVDPITYVTAVALMLGVAVMAAYIPAFRASRVEPMIALRGGDRVTSQPAERSGSTQAPARDSGEFCIEVQNLQKTYTTFPNKPAPALSGVSFKVEAGTIFGLIGQNGAGKTTLVKILMGLAMPTSGSARLLGCTPGNSIARRRIGYLPEHMRIPPHFNALNFMRYMGKLNGMDSKVIEERIPPLLKMVDLEGVTKPVKGFSKGMLQRLGLAQAMINDPELLFLDEPTDGLDPLGRIFVRDLLVQLRSQGKTVFLNSHLLSEIELVCDRILILDKGAIACSTTPAELAEGAGEYSIHFVDVDAALKQRVTAAAESVGVSVAWHEDSIRFRPRDIEHLNEVLDALRAGRVPIVSVVPERLSLEQFFIQVVGQKES